MTNPLDISGLIALARRRKRVPSGDPEMGPLTGGYINPDGPKFAEALQYQAIEIERLREYAREASRELTHHSGGGSEMFKNVAGEPYADPKLCRERIWHRNETARKLYEARATLEMKREG